MISLTKYRNYKNVYNIDVKRYSIYGEKGGTSNKDLLSIGDEINILIKEMDNDGRGIGFYKGRKIIVPKGLINEKVRVRIIKVINGVFIGTVIRRYNDSY